MNPKEITFSRKLVTQLIHQAQLTPDVEICGFISARNDIPQHCYPVKNIAETPETRFLMDPEQQVASMSKIRDEGEDVFAIYHSHPTADPVPSAMDIEQSNYSDAYYLIISLNTKGLVEMRCFQLLHDENISEIRLTMSED
jgi:proteasome lid subunit RPN8/RPN11